GIRDRNVTGVQTCALPIFQQQVPKSQIVSTQPYEPGNTNVAPQITALQKAGAQVLVDFTIPAYTALGQLTSFKLGYKPQLVVSRSEERRVGKGGECGGNNK